MLSILFDASSDPIMFWNVRWYGFCIGIGMALCILVITLRLNIRYKINSEVFYYFCILGIPVSLLGARIGSCIIGQTEWSEIITGISEGGMSIEWAVIVCVVVGIIYFNIVLKYIFVKDHKDKNREKNVSIFVYCDAIIPAILLGQAIGRWGNYFNGELYGPAIKNVSYAHFIESFLPLMKDDIDPSIVYHPFFLYESVLDFVGFILIYYVIILIKQKKCGDLAFLYFVYYGTIRLILEPFRIGDSSTDGGNTNPINSLFYNHGVNVLTSMGFVLAGIVLIFINHIWLVKYREHKKHHIIYID